MILRSGSIVFGILIAAFAFRPAPAPVPVGPQVQVMVAADAPKEVRLKKRGNGHFFVHGMVNGQIVEFLVDTGATGIALTVRDAERVGLKVEPGKFRVIGSGASGPVRGQIEQLESVEVEGRTVTNLSAMIAQGLEVSLLGQEFLAHAGSLTMSGDTMVIR